MSEIELKPCLYCKEKRVSIDIDVIESPTEYNAFARCCNCDAQGPGAYRHDTKEAAMTEAAGLWNARPLENAAKPYTYIGKDGYAVLARALEDQRDAAHKRIEELEEALKPFALLEFEDCETTQQVWEVVYAGRFRDWVSFDDIDRARGVLSKGDT
jgi:hypothetical protein